MLKELAGKNVLDAKYDLYIEGISKNNNNNLTESEAINYLEEAAKEGYAAAQLQLGFFYSKNDFGGNNEKKAHFWIEKSAEQNNSDALRITASDYFIGKGVPRDDRKGFQWLMRAYSKLGVRFDNWARLGYAYEKARGTPKDLVKAYMCFDQMGTAGIEEKARIAPLMTAEEQAEGLRLSREWQQKYHSYTFQSLGLTHQQDGSYR